jgi:formamidopyrimidine-DNA glycosylase
MPEGPEVTRVATQVNALVKNSLLESITILTGRYTKQLPTGYIDFESALQKGALLIKSINNKGKFIWWELENNWFIFCSLGMSGSYSLVKNSHSRIAFDITKVSSTGTENIEVYFSDIRNFGTIKFVNDINILNKKLDSIGPDMLNNPSSFVNFLKIARKYNNKTIVSFLMDQKIISGVGNIYKSESLFLSQISPLNTLKDLSEEDLLRLYNSIIAVLKESYNTGGTTIQTYKDLYENENSGNFASKLLIYGKSKDIYGNKVEKITLDDNRTTYFSPVVQY